MSAIADIPEKQPAQENTPGGIPSLINQYRVPVVILSLYTFITVLMTYPVAFSPGAVAGGGDAFFYLWDLWWFKKALLSFADPYFTPYLFYPDGLDLAYSTITPFNGIISIPFQFFLNVVVVYNILWLCSFIIAGYGTYLLVYFLTKNHHAAFIAGLIYAFSPYHFAHALGHLSLITIQWIPFFVLYLYKTIREDNLRNPLLAGFFLVLVGLSDVNYLLYSMVFTVILLMFTLVHEKKKLCSRQGLTRLSLFILVSGIGTFLVVFPLLREFLTAQSPYQDFGSMEMSSADIMAFFTPSKLHPLFGAIVDPFYSHLPSNFVESTVFIGYSVLFLVIVALIKKRGSEMKFWVLAGVIFFFLSLGPYLHCNGLVTITTGASPWKIPLPGIIQTLPVISMAHVPARWDVMIMLVVSVIAGYGLTVIFKKFRKKSWKTVPVNSCISVILVIFILFEFLAVPYPVTVARIPEYYGIFAQDNNSYAIYETPDQISFLSSPANMYYQTFHEKPILSGYTHITESDKKFKQTTPLIRDIYFVAETPENNGGSSDDIFRQNVTKIGKSVLNYYNIRYVILHESLLTMDQTRYSNALLKRAVNSTPRSVPGEMVKIYQVPHEPVQPFMMLGDGFSPLEILNGTRTRWISDNATVLIHSGDNRTISLIFQANSSRPAQELHLFSGEAFIHTYSVRPEPATFSAKLVLQKGENVIRFRVVKSGNATTGASGNLPLRVALQDIRIL